MTDEQISSIYANTIGEPDLDTMTAMVLAGLHEVSHLWPTLSEQVGTDLGIPQSMLDPTYAW